MLEITVASFGLTARFEEERAPETVAAFRRLLPLDSQLIQARWSGQAAWIPFGDLDLGIGFEDPTSYPGSGRAPDLPRRRERDGDPLPVRADVLREQGRTARGQPLRHGRGRSGASRGDRPPRALGRRAADPLRGAFLKGLAHWDDVTPRDLRRGPMQLDRIDLGDAAGTKDVGVARLKIDPGGRSSPVHVELDEEEIFYVLSGSGLLWQNGKTHEIRTGDCIVHRVAEEEHTLVAGPDGLDVLAFGERTRPTATYLPRAGVLRMDVTVKAAEDRHPWDLEAEAGELELPEPSPRPPNVVNRDDVTPEYDGTYWDLASAAGSERTGLNYIALPPGEEGAPPHCHSVEEEIFVVLDGSGILVLWPTPGARRGDRRRGRRFTSARRPCRLPPPSDRDRAPLPSRGRDVHVPRLRDTQGRTTSRYYPRSNKIYFRGVGLIARLDRPRLLRRRTLLGASASIGGGRR